MKKAILMIATILVAASAFAQTKEDINASVERAKKLSELCAKFPKASGASEVDAYAKAVLVAPDFVIAYPKNLRQRV